MKPGHAVVIGAGVGGLTSALLLAMRGWTVTVCEQHTRPGGFLHRFFRDSHPYDTGFHYCGGIGYDDLLGRALRHLGVFEQLDFLPLDPDGFDRIRVPGCEFRVPVGVDAYRQRLVETFPHEAPGIHGFIDDLEEAVGEYGLYAFKQDVAADRLLHWERRTLVDVMDAHVRDPVLRAVLAGQFPLYGVPPSEAPFGVHAVILHHFLRGAWRVHGGGDRLAATMVRRLRSMGGTVRLRTPVRRILVEDKTARGVVVGSNAPGAEDHEETIPADFVISNAHPRVTMGMLPEGAVRKAYRTRIEGQKHGQAHLGVYVELDGGGPSLLGNSNLYSQQHLDADACIQDVAPGQVGFYFATAPGEAPPPPPRPGAPANRPPPHDVLLLLAPLSWQAVQAWQDSRHGARPDAYAALKQEKTHAVVDAVCADLPGLRDRIRRVEASTPLTTAHFVKSPQGAMYGHYHSVDQMGRNRPPQFIRVRHMAQVGAAVLFPGVLGAMVSAYYAVGAILDMPGMLRELNALPRGAA